MRVTCAGFEVETVINVRVARARLSVVEVPSSEQPRIHGESNLNAVRDGLRVLRAIVSERLRVRRVRPNDDWRPPFRELPAGETTRELDTFAIASLGDPAVPDWGLLPITVTHAEGATAG
jgi:hypothetical protein